MVSGGVALGGRILLMIDDGNWNCLTSHRQPRSCTDQDHACHACPLKQPQSGVFIIPHFPNITIYHKESWSHGNYPLSHEITISNGSNPHFWWLKSPNLPTKADLLRSTDSKLVLVRPAATPSGFNLGGCGWGLDTNHGRYQVVNHGKPSPWNQMKSVFDVFFLKSGVRLKHRFEIWFYPKKDLRRTSLAAQQMNSNKLMIECSSRNVYIHIYISFILYLYMYYMNG
jgi:hypothetical protein